jgi:hypothetical protein
MLFRLLVLMTVLDFRLLAVDGQERWLYEQRPLSFGTYSDHVFMDSRLGPGCWQKRFAPNQKGNWTARITGVPCPEKFTRVNLPCGKVGKDCEGGPSRSNAELLLIHRPYQILKDVTQGSIDIIRSKGEK